MATERLRFCTEEERVAAASNTGENNVRPRNAIFEIELGTTQFQLKNEAVVAKVQLEKKLGHLGYLKNLKMMKAKGNAEECPICRNALGHSWALLVCGHCYCCDCIHTLATR